MDADLSLATVANPILSACSEATQAALFAAGHVRQFQAGELVIKDGEPVNVVLFPLRGSLQLSKTTPRGRRQIFCGMSLTMCNGLCLLTFGDRALADVWGFTDGAVLLAPGGAFIPLAREDSVLCQAAWRSATACMAHLSELVTQLSFNTVAERVAGVLWSRTQVDGDTVRLTQSELAAEVGTTREVVARCVADLQADGIIKLRRALVIVLDRAKLDSLSREAGA